MPLQVSAVVVSIVSAGIVIGSIVQAIRLRQQTKKEAEEQLSFITHLVVNSAADPDAVRKMLMDYEKAGGMASESIQEA
jgi:hypothetical protein